MGGHGAFRWISASVLALATVTAQVIEFESGGLKYQTLTRNGFTIMVAELPSNVREYAILQVAISNGGTGTWTIRPEDFLFVRSDGETLQALPPRTVVNSLVQRASRGDVIKLVTAYEQGIYGNNRYQATNGFEARRQGFLAEVGSARLKAAAAASAIAFSAIKVNPGQSTDGAIFYANAGKALGSGMIRVRAAGSTYEFPMLTSN